MNIIAIVIIVFVSIIIVGWLVGLYNSIVRLKNNIKKAFSNIDVLLKQRSDELPKLIDTVKGYMKYEQETLEKVTAARTAFLNAGTPEEKMETGNQLSGALKSLFAVSENYPELKAQSSFQQLQTRISGLENEIADRREFYNDSVNTYNIRIQEFPAVIIANMAGYKEENVFEATTQEREDVKVSFE